MVCSPGGKLEGVVKEKFPEALVVTLPVMVGELIVIVTWLLAGPRPMISGWVELTCSPVLGETIVKSEVVSVAGPAKSDENLELEVASGAASAVAGLATK